MVAAAADLIERSLGTVRATAARGRAHLLLGALVCGLLLAPAGGDAVLLTAGLTAALLATLSLPGLAVAAAVLALAGGALGAARLEAIDAGAEHLAAAAGALSGGAAPFRVGAGAIVDAPAHLLERPRPGRFGSSAAVRVRSGPLAGVRLYARAPADIRWPAGVRPGSELRVRGTARLLPGADGGEPRAASGEPRGDEDESGEGEGSARARTAGRFDFAAHLRRRGIAGELALVAVDATGHWRGGIAGALDTARGRAERALARGLPADEAALARGLVLGQDERIGELMRDDFRDSGLAHLLAVSGQNVMLLSALALPVLALTGLGSYGRVAAMLALIAAYVPLAGAGPSLQRAGVMGGAGLVALAAGRPASRWYALLLAAAVTLAINPRVSGDPGWQLSFAAVVGIVVLAPGLRRTLRSGVDALAPALGGERRTTAALAPAPAGERRSDAPGGARALRDLERIAARLLAAAPRVLADGIAITIAATLATVPLLAFHFGAVPLVSLPANVLALPAVAPVMWTGMAQAALGQLDPLPVAGAAAGAAAEALAAPAGVLLRYLASVAEHAAALAEPLQLELSVGGAVAAYALLGAAALLVRRTARRAGPAVAAALAAVVRLPPHVRAAGAVGVLLAALVATAPAWRGPPAPAALRVSFLDVGQGDATLVQHPDGTAVLFDAGPPEARVARLLRRAGARRLDVLVATHASRDHHGGLLEVLERVPVRLLVDGGDGTDDAAFRRAVAEARRRGVRIVRAKAGMALRAGGLTIDVLSPPPRPPGPPPEDPNPRAVVAIVSSGAFDLFLSADAESDAVARLPLRDVDAMKVPHHGSADPGLPEILGRLRPEVAAIEVGAGNGYGHPAPSTLDALAAAVPRVHRTDRDGTVTLEVEAGRMRVRTER